MGIVISNGNSFFPENPESSEREGMPLVWKFLSPIQHS